MSATFLACYHSERILVITEMVRGANIGAIYDTTNTGNLIGKGAFGTGHGNQDIDTLCNAVGALRRVSVFFVAQCLYGSMD